MTSAIIILLLIIIFISTEEVGGESTILPWETCPHGVELIPLGRNEGLRMSSDVHLAWKEIDGQADLLFDNLLPRPQH